MPATPKDDGEGYLLSYDLLLTPIEAPSMDPITIENWNRKVVSIIPEKWDFTVTAFITYDGKAGRLPVTRRWSRWKSRPRTATK